MKDKVEFSISFTSNPNKILIAARCECGNKMVWVTEGTFLCEKCKEYSKLELRSKRLA